MSDTHSSGAPWRNFYGRFHGKTLRTAQQDYLRDLPDVSITGVSLEENPDRTPLDIDPVTQGKPLWLEIGFGSGEHLVHQATSNPDVTIIGAEPFINGVATCLGKLRATPAPNLRLYMGDARDLLDVLPDASLARAFLLYPDPWPKARHHRRRFVTPEHLIPLHRVMATGAELRIATDIPDYVRQTLEEVPKAGFTCTAATGDAWPDWTRTRYEAKAIREDRTPHYLTFHAA